MKATDLIGKMAIRTAATSRIGDHSYCAEPIFIVYATDAHIIYRYPEGSYLCGSEYILAYDFCDDNWIDFADLAEHMTVVEEVAMPEEDEDVEDFPGTIFDERDKLLNSSADE